MRLHFLETFNKNEQNVQLHTCGCQPPASQPFPGMGQQIEHRRPKCPFIKQ
jgi:hypothetical protein